METFKINVSAGELDDLKQRLKACRWPDEIDGSGWAFGTDKAYLRELTNYWANDFDWRKVEGEINSLPAFLTEVNGCRVHFVHIKSGKPNSIPLILTHGWPGSFLEMLKLIPLLNGHEDISYDLVIPSMPGFGFSQKITQPGCNVQFIADVWVELMKSLGYDRFIAQGGDFGAGVTTAMALKYPQHLMGIHLNYIPRSYQPSLLREEALTVEETDFLKSLDHWFDSEGGYCHQQETRPLTLAYGLNDSPVGLLAWIIEKFHSWADCGENLESIFTKDELLTNVMVYWLTQTIHSSIRLYNENRKSPFHFGANGFVEVPVGIARFPYEEPFPPRRYIERGYRVIHWSEMPAGGHFAAMEQPKLLAKDILLFTSRLINVTV